MRRLISPPRTPRPLSLLAAMALLGGCFGDDAPEPTGPAQDVATGPAQDAGPGAPDTDPGSADTDPGSADTDPGSADTDPGSADTDPGSTDTDPGSADSSCQLNACGGCAVLDGAPGDACGPCGKDKLACGADKDSLVCDGETPCCETDSDCPEGEHCDANDCFPGLCPEAERNACGGCEALSGAIGDACGPCAKDRLACGTDLESLVCSGATPCSAPTVTTGDVTDITQYTATLTGSLDALGDRPVTAHGFCRAESGVPALGDGVASCSDLGPKAAAGPFTEALADLRLGSPFVVRAYAVTEAGVGYGDVVSWRTADAVLPVVETVAAEATGDGSAIRVTAHLDVVGIPQNSGHGVCLGTAPGPALGDGASTCQELGTAAAPGPFTVTYEGLGLGATYHVRAYVVATEGAIYGAERTVTLRPAAPVITNVGFRTDTEKVALSWDAVPGATGYRVLRDNAALTTAPITTTAWEDATAAAGPAPTNTGLGLVASSNDPLKVRLSWSAPEVTPGRTYAYTVVAVNAAGDSAPSQPREGARAAYPVTGYEVTINGGNAIAVNGLAYDDLTAPPGLLTQANAAASQGTSSEAVFLTLTGAEAQPGATVNYRVRARSAAGAGADSDVAQGARAADAVTLVWQRSSGTTDAGYSDLASATTREFADTTAPTNEVVRFYRARVTAGDRTVTTAAVSGYRGANLPVLATAAPTFVTQTSCFLNGSVTSLGTAATLSAHGYCWSATTDPTWSSGAPNCQSFGARDTTGALGAHQLTGLTAGKRYYFRVFSVFNKAGTPFTVYSQSREFWTLPPTPVAPTASTNDPLKVTLTWPRQDNVSAYVVTRAIGSGAATEVATVQVGASATMTWSDTSAPAPATPAAVGNLAVKDQSCSTVSVAWTAPGTPAAGSSATYRVIAINSAGRSPASGSATGNRAAAPLTGFRVTNLRTGAVAVLNAAATSSLIIDTPALTVTPGTITTTVSEQSHPGYVRLVSNGAARNPVVTDTVRVQALNVIGTGAPAEVAAGRHPNCPLNIQWQRADAVWTGLRWVSSSEYTDISGAVGATYDDTGAPAGGSAKMYRARVYLGWNESVAQNTGSVMGRRYARSPAATNGTPIQNPPGSSTITTSMKITDLGVPAVTTDFGMCVTGDASIAVDNIRPGVNGVFCRYGATSATLSLYAFTFVPTDGIVRERLYRTRCFMRNASSVTNATATGGYTLGDMNAVYMN